MYTRAGQFQDMLGRGEGIKKEKRRGNTPAGS